MANRHYSQFPEKKLGAATPYGGKDRKAPSGSRAEKSNATLKDSEPGYQNYGKERGYSLNRATKFPIVKTVVEADGVDL